MEHYLNKDVSRVAGSGKVASQSVCSLLSFKHHGRGKHREAIDELELLDAAVWREIGSEEPQPAGAFLEALSALVGR